MSEEICHVCGKVKKPYIVFMNSDIINFINHDMAREDGPICERCDRYYAMTSEFKDPTDEEFELALQAVRFSQAMLKWWTKDKPLYEVEKEIEDGYFSDEPSEREWAGTHALNKWYREEYGKTK